MTKTAAAIVLFKPDAAVWSRVTTLARQVGTLYVVDNSPEEDIAVERLPSNCVKIDNRNRGGLAGALNLAVDSARDAGTRFLVLFDQDTEIDSEFCSRITNLALRKSSSVAAIGPMHINSSTGHSVRLSVPGRIGLSYWPTRAERPVECYFLINSGCLLDLQVIPADVRYDESLGVDMTDVDFCLSLRRRGLKAQCYPILALNHGIGNRVQGSSRFSPTNYPVWRKEAQARARVVVWRRYLKVYPWFVAMDAALFVGDATRVALFEAQGFTKLVAIVRGARAGIGPS